jgi:POT family proton-dependent oligopeptide transporter
VIALWASCIGQSDGTLLLWARDHARRVLLGHEVPASVFATLPALLVLILSPIVGMLGRFSVTRSPSRRIAIGMWCTSLAMALMALAALLANGAPSSAAWLLGCFTFLIIGEILVAPLIQSVLSGLAPRSANGLVVAASYGAIAIGYWLAGTLGALWLRWPQPAFFGLLSGVALLGGLLLKLGGRFDEVG